MKAIYSVWKLCCFEYWEKEIRNLLVEPFAYFSFTFSPVWQIGSLKAPESCLYGWQQCNKRKMLIKNNRPFFLTWERIPVQSWLCLGSVGGCLLWEIKRFYCFPSNFYLFIFPFMLCRNMSAVPQAILFYPCLHALDSPLSCGREIMDVGGD